MFGNKAQMQSMMKKARKMQEDMAKAKEEIKHMTVDVTVGGGAISLTMNGEHQVTALHISPDAIDPADVECWKISSRPPSMKRPAKRMPSCRRKCRKSPAAFSCRAAFSDEYFS